MTHGLYPRHKNIALTVKLWELMVDVWWEEDSFCTFLHLDRTFFLRRTLCTIFSTFRELWYDASSACDVGYLTVSAMFLWREYNPCVMPSNLYRQVFPRYPCSGPVRRSQADLLAGSLELWRGAKKLHLRNAHRVTVCSYAPPFLNLKRMRSSLPKSPGCGPSYI